MEVSKEKEGPDLDRIGLFSEMSYHNEYVPLKISFNDSAKRGRQMMTNCSRSKAGNQDGFFDPRFQRAFEGEAYSDRIRFNRLGRLEKAKKNLGSSFKYSSPTKKPSGKGSHYGTFAEYEEKLEHFSSNVKDREKHVPSKKNFYTNPSQKGTGYGYPNLTIGKLPPYFLEKEYDELKNETKKPKTQPRTSKPFHAGIFQQGYFDPNPYKADEALSTDEIQNTKNKIDEEQQIKTPFFPSSPSKRDGGMKAGCLSSFPEYSSEPYPKMNSESRGTKRYVNTQNQMFRPVPGIRPYPVKSIINTNVQKKVNSANFTTIKGVVYCENGKK